MPSDAPAISVTEGSSEAAPARDQSGKRSKRLLEYDKAKPKDYTKDILDRVKAIQRNRAGYEKQWLVNTAFVYGRQHFDVQAMPRTDDLSERIVWEIKDIQRKRREKSYRTVNYILPLWRSALARMIQMKSRINVEPEKRDQEDVAAARVGQELLEDFWLNANKMNPILCQDVGGMLKVILKLMNYMTLTGRGWLMPYFNAQTPAKLMLRTHDAPNGEVVEGQGQIECKIFSPFDVFDDPMRGFVCYQELLSTEQIGDFYDKEVEPEEIGMTNTDRQLQRLLGGQELDELKYKDGAMVYTFFHNPTKAHPEGQFSAFTKEHILQEPVPIPAEYKRRIPLFKFGYIEIMSGQHPLSLVEPLIPLQEELNYTAERVSGYKKFLAGKLMMPYDCRPSVKWDDEIGQIVKYDPNGGKPEYMAGGAPPVFILREFDRIRRDMEDISSTHDVSMSRVPGGVKSGIAIENLQEADNSQLAPQLIDTEAQLSFFGQMVLDIAEARYDQPRMIGIAGKNLAVDVRIFTGADLLGQKRVKITLGSNMPTNKEARQAKILELGDRGLISPEKQLEFLEFGDVEGIFHDIDRQAERMEILEMIRGVEVIPADWENHTVRIAVLTEFMKSSDYQKLPPEIQDVFLSHLRMHRLFLQQEMAAASAMTAPAPKPAPSGPVGKSGAS